MRVRARLDALWAQLEADCRHCPDDHGRVFEADFDETARLSGSTPNAESRCSSVRQCKLHILGHHRVARVVRMQMVQACQLLPNDRPILRDIWLRTSGLEIPRAFDHSTRGVGVPKERLCPHRNGRRLQPASRLAGVGAIRVLRVVTRGLRPTPTDWVTESSGSMQVSS
jgi:hypothetical protein